MNDRTNIATITDKPRFSLTPTTIDEAMRFADMLSKSALVPKDYQGNPANCVIAMQWGMEIGLQPLQAMQSIAVINGRPAIWGDAMIALVKGSGLLESITENVGEDVATCSVKRRGEAEVSRTFSMADAKRAGLAGKQGPWAQYPKRMMQMRARAWALRDVFPDVLRGVFVAEEAQDIPKERDITAEGETIKAPAVAASRTDSVKAKLAAKQAVPAVLLDGVLEAIAAAPDEASLKRCAELAGKLGSDADKAAARDAYKARKASLEAENVSQDAPSPMTYAQVAERLNQAGDAETLDAHAAEIDLVAEAGQRDDLAAMYRRLRDGMEG
jgi:hypothetical protein